MADGAGLAAVERWFERLGYQISHTTYGNGVVWANLVRPQDGSIIAPKYGRGSGRLEAARSAQDRYKIER